MISRRLGYSLIYLVVVVVVGCGRAPGSSSVGPNGNVPRAADHATTLAATLSTLNLSNPVADLDANLARGYRRFLTFVEKPRQLIEMYWLADMVTEARGRR
jgi:hypothetical protein